MADTKKINRYIILSCVIGLGLSCYAYVVETSKEADHSYEALCDISEHMSCSKAFMSEYGKGFGIIHSVAGKDSSLNVPNSLIGMVFYSIFAALCGSSSMTVARLQLIMAVISNIGSVYLAYVLYFILYDFCVICISTYIVNFVNLILAFQKVRQIALTGQRKVGDKKKVK